MTAHEARSGFDYLRSACRFSQVSEPDNQASASLVGEQDVRGAGMISLHQFAMHRGESLDHGTQVSSATPPWQPLRNLASVSQQAHAVTRMQRYACQAQSRTDGVVQLVPFWAAGNPVL